MTLKSIEDNAIIKVKSKQITPGDKEVIEFITEGRFYKRGSRFFVFYRENEQMGMANCTVMLIIDDNSIVMRRKGEFELKLTYSEGKSESVIYYLPYGMINMTQTTQMVRSNINNNGGKIELVYTMDIDGRKQRNELEINIEKT